MGKKQMTTRITSRYCATPLARAKDVRPRALGRMGRAGYTLIELLAGVFVIATAIIIGESIARQYGALAGTGAGLFAGSLSVIMVVLFYRWLGRRDDRRLQELREKYRGIYRIVNLPPDPTIIIMPKGAEIRSGDYGWEAEPIRNDGLIYLHGLTPAWTVVWHAGFRPEQIERVATKPHSQYDSWHPYWAEPPALPPCPFPVLARETMTIGRPHHSHRYFVNPALYRTRQAENEGPDEKPG